MHRRKKRAMGEALVVIDFTAAVEIYPGLLSAIPSFMPSSHLPCVMYS